MGTSGQVCGACGSAIEPPPGLVQARFCTACGSAVAVAGREGLLSLELPPEQPAGDVGATPPTAPPPKPASPRRRERERERDEEKPVVTSGPRSTRARKVKLTRQASLALPKRCACCFADKPDGSRLDSRELTVGGYRQSWGIHVPYCAPCLKHHVRPKVRLLVRWLAFGLLVAAYVVFVGEAPDSFEMFSGLLAAAIVAAGAIGHLFVPRSPVRDRHAREGKAAWIRAFDEEHVTLVVCNGNYLDLLAPPGPRGLPAPGVSSKWQPFRWLGGLFYGFQKEISKVPILSVLRPLVTLGLIAAAWHFFPITPDERAFRAFQASPNFVKAADFARRFPMSRRLRELEEHVWSRAQASEDPYPYEFYLSTFPKGRHRDEAVGAMHEAAFLALRKVPTYPAAIQFIRKYPGSPHRQEAQALMLTAIESSGPAPEHAPPVPVLRRMLQSASSGRIPVSVQGFEDLSYRSPVVNRLTEALSGLGLVADLVEKDGLIQVQGRNGQDTTYSYSKFFVGGGGPYAEYATAEVLVKFSPDGPPAWTATVHARSPSTVKYTTYRFGGGSPIDTGPGQNDVHQQTVPVFVDALRNLFNYAPTVKGDKEQ